VPGDLVLEKEWQTRERGIDPRLDAAGWPRVDRAETFL